MDAEQLASIMLLAPDLIDDEDLLMIILADCEEKGPLTHYKYARFAMGNFTDEEFKKYFRFSKEHVKELRILLQLKECYKSGSHLIWSGEEGLCIILRRLAYPNRLCDLVPMFGRHLMELSVIFNVMLNEVYRKHQDKLQSVQQAWVNYEEFAEAISAKGAVLHNVWGFIDGTQGRLCRPNVGQESVFNGHKCIHSLKYQSVICPNGMIVHFFGPIEGRQHDSAVYYLSGLDDQISNIYSANGQQLSLYGDTAYAFRRYLVTPFKGAQLAHLKKEFNKNMASLRTCVEWGFAKIVGVFAFLAFHKNQKVYLQPVAKYWLVGALLCNCHTCYYRSQTGKYFDIAAPSIHKYLSKNVN